MLYLDSSKMWFRSDEEEIKFWTRASVSTCELGKRGIGQTLWPCAVAFRSGLADFVEPFPFHGTYFYRTYILREGLRIKGHQERVRKLTERMLGAQIDEELARVAERRVA